MPNMDCNENPFNVIEKLTSACALKFLHFRAEAR